MVVLKTEVLTRRRIALAGAPGALKAAFGGGKATLDEVFAH